MTNEPKWTRATLDVINNTYVVRNGLLYEYYPISCFAYSSEDKFIKLEISPGVMVSGIAILAKQLYDVSLEDLFRRRINVSKRHGRTTDDNVGRSSTVQKSKSPKLQTNPEQSGLGSLFGGEVDQAANMAWKDQVNTLLEAISTEEGEEFEITGSTQPRQFNESSSVQDLFEDT